MSDKELLKLLGLEDGTISIGLDDEYARIVLEKMRHHGSFFRHSSKSTSSKSLKKMKAIPLL